MGQESEAAERRKIFLPFQVNQKLFSCAAKHAVFMHCLPAHRGDEVAAGVIDSSRSVVFDQAENRLHIQKAIMVLLLEGGAHRFPPRSAHA
jgi:ornithine carbamoyltransferase